jgi:hypothetical protein
MPLIPLDLKAAWKAAGAACLSLATSLQARDDRDAKRPDQQTLVVRIVLLAALLLRLAVPLGVVGAFGLAQPAIAQSYSVEQPKGATAQRSHLSADLALITDCHCPRAGHGGMLGRRCNCLGSQAAFYSNARLIPASLSSEGALVTVPRPTAAFRPTESPPPEQLRRGLAAPPPPTQAPPSFPSDCVTA